MAKKTTGLPDLEKSLAQLEAIVRQLEDGDIPLEQALKQFEEGVRISRNCQQALVDAEQRVQTLVDGQLQDFKTESIADDTD